jgi:hypothetical protein
VKKSDWKSRMEVRFERFQERKMSGSEGKERLMIRIGCRMEKESEVEVRGTG